MWEQPDQQPQRVRCRNTRCRSKLPVPTDNDHKAFCTPYCYNQFYNWRCKVCEKSILKGKRRKQPDHCHSAECRSDFRRFPDIFTYPKSTPGSPTVNYGSRSAHKTGGKSAHNPPAAYRIVAGPPISDFAFWAANLGPATPVGTWREILRREAEWRERDAADAKYVAEDEERLRRLDQAGVVP
jgi:hypothetical protein